MTNKVAVRARSGASLALDKHTPRAAYQQTDLASLAPYMFLMMMRNVTSDGFVLEDPASPGRFSLPGCVIAAPSFPANNPMVDQNYVFNWVRDAAITAIEIASANIPALPDGGGVQALNDYVSFAAVCQANATPTMGHACFAIDGNSRPWSEQNDGPAIQSIAMIYAHDQLDEASQALARDVIDKNIAYLLDCYQQPTTNLWEEHVAHSFFTRAVQLKCFREIAANKLGIAIPAGVKPAIKWLESAIAEHWNGTLYVSMLKPEAGAGVSLLDDDVGYDPNIDIISAAIYGAVPFTDTRLLATAGIMRRIWADSASDGVFPINVKDQAKGIGPLMGRYPGDTYDGDVAHPVRGGHPWPLCTANFAELYFRLASEIERTRKVPLDDQSREFFAQVGVTADHSPADAAAALRDAGDAMMRAIVSHSDHYELSEQYDGTDGIEKSVRDLTWSYAAFLSAIRARKAKPARSPRPAAKPAKAPAKSSKAPVKTTSTVAKRTVKA